MLIAVDICNTLCNVNKAIEKKLGLKRISGSYLIDGVPEEFFIENPEFFAFPKPFCFAAATLRMLSRQHTLVYLTARPDSSRKITIEYLKRFGFPEAPIVFTNNKADTAKQLGVNLALEDAPHEIMQYKAAGIPVLIKDWDYNRNFDTVRFKWTDLYFVLKKVC